MSNELLNILSGSNKDIDEQKLMNYLNDKLTAEEKHDLEKQMADSEFVNDAVEGLENLKNKNDLQLVAEKINANLHAQLDKNKKRKEKRKLKDHPWIYLAIILILLLLIISFIVIKKHLDNDKGHPKTFQGIVVIGH